MGRKGDWWIERQVEEATRVPEGLLQRLLDRLDRNGVPNEKFPDKKGEYWTHCPFHEDEHATNFSVSLRGYCCFACGAKGSLADLAAKLGVGAVDVLTQFRGGGVPPLTLEEYAEAKRLPLGFVQELG